MAREITHEAQGPTQLDEDDLDGGPVFLCRCGLSNDQPFCDGSHTATADEADDTVYKYEGDDDENPRHPIDHIEFADE